MPLAMMQHIQQSTGRQEGQSLHQGMGDQMEETTCSPSSLAEHEGNSKTNQHIADMGNTGISQQTFYFCLPQRHQVADQDIEAAKNEQNRSPVSADLAQQAETAQHGDQTGFDDNTRKHGADTGRGL